MDEALIIEQDAARDIVTINGVKYSGHLFRTLALCEPGTWLRFEGRRDGAITVFTPGPDLERAFDVLSGKGAVCGAS